MTIPTTGAEMGRKKDIGEVNCLRKTMMQSKELPIGERHRFVPIHAVLKPICLVFCKLCRGTVAVIIDTSKHKLPRAKVKGRP